MTRLLALVLVVPALAAAAPVLDTDLSHYTILGMRRVRLKNFAMEPPGCHVGVNCASPSPGSPCGVLHAKHARFAPTSQVVADHLCATESFYEVFRNSSLLCGPDCSMISSPGPASDCTTPFAVPLVGDLDGDGKSSCSPGCDLDFDDIARACGVTLPLPACDPSRPILALRNMDCSSDDVVPGNFQCDLAAGTYGYIFVRDGARIEFAEGTTVACRVRAGKATRLKSAGPATILVPAPGTVKINNASDAGSFCSQLTFVTERGNILLGRNGDFAVDACSIGGKLNLGHGNNLQGRFVGMDVAMDFNNDGRCCVPPPPPSSTTTTVPATTTTTGPTTSTTTTTASTTTTTVVATSTTTTTGDGTTTTTLGGDGLFTRTVGFYKTHPDVTQAILDAHGPFTICGQTISDTDVGHAHSALEAMCISPMGDQRIQLARQLTAATLSTLAGGAQFDVTVCNALCADPSATPDDLTACIDAADTFNNSGDNVQAPWDPSGPANSAPCDVAANTPCSIVDPSACTAP